MAVTAPVPGFSLAALARWAASLPLPLPEGAASSAKPGRTADEVVFSSAPSRLLSNLAVAGLRQLTALLPTLTRAVEQPAMAPLGHLAKAVASAARQVGDGHAALLSEGPDRAAAAFVRAPFTETRPDLRMLARQLGAEGKDGVKAPALPVRGPTMVAPPDLPILPRQIGAPPPTAPAPGRPEAKPGAAPPPGAAIEPAEPTLLPRGVTTAEPPEPPAKAALRAVARELGMIAAPVPEAELGLQAKAAPSDAAPATMAKSSRAAAQQADEPARPDRPAEPRPDMADDILRRWVGEAKHALRDAGDLLERAERQVRELDRQSDAPVAAPAEPTKVAIWAMSEIVAAQAQVAAAYRNVLAAPLPSERMAAGPAFPLANGAFLGRVAEQLAGGIGLLGIAITLAILWLADGIWSIAAGIAAFSGVMFWTWRLLLAARGVRLDGRR